MATRPQAQIAVVAITAATPRVPVSGPVNGATMATVAANAAAGNASITAPSASRSNRDAQ